MRELTPEQRERFERMLPIRVVLRINDQWEIEGLVEHSFSMGWSNSRVNVRWSGTAHSNLGTTHMIDAVEDTADAEIRDGGIVVDPLDPNSPIEVDWAFWMEAQRKFDFRNPPFKVKDMSDDDTVETASAQTPWTKYLERSRQATETGRASAASEAVQTLPRSG